VFDCFAGYGGAEFALAKANIPHKCVGFSEIDKYAIQCFQQNHKGVKNWGDITKINWDNVPEFDLLTGGFPCQDISQAGKQDLSKGRSVLVNELIRCLREKQPKYFLFENVGAIETKPFREFLRGIENDFKRCGYQVFRKALNSKDFGVPQNRLRVWWIGYRKDLAKPFGFTPYPKEEELKLKLKDVLEPEVDEKYFLKPSVVSNLFSKERKISERLPNKDGVCGTLLARDYKENKCVVFDSRKYKGGVEKRSYDNISPTLMARARTDEAPIVAFDAFNQTIPKEQGVSTSLRTNWNNGNMQLIKGTKVRRLTPKECFRLMGFLNDEINLEGLSDTQRYRLAGNGWEINLVSKIFKKMFEV